MRIQPFNSVLFMPRTGVTRICQLVSGGFSAGPGMRSGDYSRSVRMAARLHPEKLAVWMVCLCGISLSSCGAAGVPCENELRRCQYSRIVMGVPARITVYAPDEAAAETSCLKAFDRLAALEQILSDYRTDSELSRLCEKSGGPPVRVSRELCYVLSRARQVSERSEGAFDVTIGPIVRLWRTARRSGQLPQKTELDAAMSVVGWRKLQIDPAGCKVRLMKRGMRLDLGGIAKGYACDEAIRVLKGCGIRRAMIEMGGDIVVGDAPPGTGGWVVETPSSRDQQSRHLLRNVAISTSADTEQYVEIGGTRYSHIVDPRTGLGLTSRLGVTVIARCGILADALSTALSVLGKEKGIGLVRRYEGVQAFFLPDS